MNARPAITFIISTYNYGQFLPEAVESICQGNLQPDDEILIVDDASTDNTADVVQELISSNAQISSLTHRYNKGCFTAGVNTAMEKAKNDLLFGLAADNLLAPNSISPLVSYMIEKNADIAAFQEVRFFTSDKNLPTHSWFFNEECTLADAFNGYEWPGSSGHYLFTRASWLKAGRCDESIPVLDSWTFGIQQLATGSKMVAMPNSYYLHRWGHESLWVRGSAEGDISLKAMRVLLPILNRFEPESVDYLLSSQGRTAWFENLRERPLLVRDSGPGKPGHIVRNRTRKDPFFRRARRYLGRKIASDLG